ncbi:MAG TPA: thiamine pyrophosphate-dependent enzyme [Saprospiraceae bacterium]|nr:thiamine pyrophosphate-dependent enzyme [Saprospiraceae bacterium]
MFTEIQGLLDSLEGQNKNFHREVLKDYWICLVSRECSLAGRKEVLTGKAKFGILGDGKELPQVAMARAFGLGDFRSGYYRDQTFMMALGLCSVEDYFAQLYADVQNDPFSKGRQMNAHFATALVNENGEWLDHCSRYNVSSDVSSTGGQMARALGLALASKQYRLSKTNDQFSKQGNEVSFCTIGDASTSEAVFWETINAASVLQVPLAVSVWDDGYGISVPKELQTAKSSISDALAGFEYHDDSNGIKIYKAKAWDYPGLVNMYHNGIAHCRQTHVPCLFHIEEVTQPQGHSTSGSHERYKSKERMIWEAEFDCIKKMEEWMIQNKLIENSTINELKLKSKEYVKKGKEIAWKNVQAQNTVIYNQLSNLLSEEGQSIQQQLDAIKNPSRHEMLSIVRRELLRSELSRDLQNKLDEFRNQQIQNGRADYCSHLYSETSQAQTLAQSVEAVYSDNSVELNGYQILNEFFDELLASDPRVYAFGEDVGQIGDVNQGFAGLQEKHGTERVFDTGIREWTIIGQAIGMSMRGLRPIAEIQYLDYIVYALSPLMDDLATVRYRTAGMQKAPAIIRTRGHRLEGIWHSGSPIGMLLHSLRGIHICVPRNMTQAAGMYRSLMLGDDPGLVIECLNGYRLKEKRPDNLHQYKVPLGQIEVLQEGRDLTLVTYGSCVRIAEQAIILVQNHGISVELIDVQTLLPLDSNYDIVKSIQKTNKLIVLDEDVPGGASAYLLQQILDVQNAYQYLDQKPICISAVANRPPYGSDGDYFTKPSADDVAEQILNMMKSYHPSAY